jgi:hypothetical protein
MSTLSLLTGACMLMMSTHSLLTLSLPQGFEVHLYL